MKEVPRKGDIIILLDIETLPCGEEDPLWEHHKRSVEERYSEGRKREEKVEEARLTTSLLPELGRIWMIGARMFIVGGGGSRQPNLFEEIEGYRLFSGKGTVAAESSVLSSFELYLQNIFERRSGEESSVGVWFVGFNIEKFDIPFIQARALKHRNNKLLSLLPSPLAKPWNRKILDIKKLIPRTGAYRDAYALGLKLGSQDAFCRFLDIKTQEGVMGSEVHEAWLQGRREDAEKHLEEDVEQLGHMLKALWRLIN